MLYPNELICGKYLDNKKIKEEIERLNLQTFDPQKHKLELLLAKNSEFIIWDELEYNYYHIVVLQRRYQGKIKIRLIEFHIESPGYIISDGYILEEKFLYEINNHYLKKFSYPWVKKEFIHNLKKFINKNVPTFQKKHAHYAFKKMLSVFLLNRILELRLYSNKELEMYYSFAFTKILIPLHLQKF